MGSMQAFLDDFGKITVLINRNFYGGRSDSFYLCADKGYCKDLVINTVQDLEYEIRYELVAPAGMRFGSKYTLREQHGLEAPLVHRLIVNTKQFNDRFYYAGNDLGATYTKEHTEFALWAPTAIDVILKIHLRDKEYTYPMERGNKGVYRLRVQGDLEKATYTYLVNRNGEIVETPDPYALSSTANGKESAVIDTQKLFAIEDVKLEPMRSALDAIIYECSIRDMTSSLRTNTKEHGTFNALREKNTKYQEIDTGFSHIQSLGVTHAQFLPVMDFATVNEYAPKKNYNWGYDPFSYIVPEGSYSSDPDDPYARCIELRKLVVAMHKANIRVNLDVVFNHVYDVGTSPFDRCVPYYYFRYNEQAYLSNGSYCGNDFASEKPMVRKYILYVIDKLMKLYCVDGFRFDLMGVLDIDTMNAIRDTALKIKKDAMIYGEGWDMPTNIPFEKKACIGNAYQMPGIGHFNDFFRDTIKGKTSDDQKHERGYGTGDLEYAQGTLSALSANVLDTPHFKRFLTAEQSINALETHDNHTVWDKMRACCGNEDRATRQKRQKLLMAIQLFAQGIPFIHAGMEFCATKNDNGNSYDAGDDINQMDWERARINNHITEYTKKCIAFRKTHRGFHLNTSEEMIEKLRLSIGDGIVFYEIDEKDETLKMIINPTMDEKHYDFAEDWKIIFDQDGNEIENKSTHVVVPALSTIVCKRM